MPPLRPLHTLWVAFWGGQVAELKAALGARGLATDGLKAALAARLLQHCTPQDPPAEKAGAHTPQPSAAKTPRSRASRAGAKQ